MMLPLLLASAALGADLALVNATVLPVSGPPLEQATVLIAEGRIEALGEGLAVPDGTPTLDLTGKTVTPGLIDVHSHMGVYSWPGGTAHSDGNEMTDPFTADVWAGDSVRVHDPAFRRARAGGVTTVQILPGSANLVGGQSAVLKLRDSRTLRGMLFADAPRGLKMACGENPKRVYGKEEEGPATRMGNLARMRAKLQEALDYRAAREGREPVPRDAELEVLLGVLDGEIRVHLHCYRHDDIEGMVRLMDEHGVRMASIQHALEAYKVRDLLIERGTAIATWPDWWGFKLEAYDAIPENILLFKEDGGVAAVHSDSADTIQRLYTEAAKLLASGLTEAQALETITLDPARMLGIDARVGTLEPGKDADLAVFSGSPFDVYSRVELTLVDGTVLYDRTKEGTPDGWP